MRLVYSMSALVLFASMVSFAQDSNFANGPQYLMNNGSPLFARSISTPSLSFQTPLPEANEGSTSSSAPDYAESSITPTAIERTADLPRIYYGGPVVSMVEITGGESITEKISGPLSVSIVNTGVSTITDVHSLRLRGYGITLPEAAAYWKVHKTPASRTYTNDDIERLKRSA
jgi:hypothetical protein